MVLELIRSWRKKCPHVFQFSGRFIAKEMTEMLSIVGVCCRIYALQGGQRNLCWVGEWNIQCARQKSYEGSGSVLICNLLFGKLDWELWSVSWTLHHNLRRSTFHCLDDKITVEDDVWCSSGAPACERICRFGSVFRLFDTKIVMAFLGHVAPALLSF